MSRWFKLPAALRRSDSEDATVTLSHTQPQAQPASPTSSTHQSQGSWDLAQVHSNDGRTSESDESARSGSETGSGSGPASPSKNGNGNGKRSLFKRGSRNYHLEKEGGGGSLSIAKRVKSSLRLDSAVNSSNMSLTSPTAGEFGTQPFNSVKSIFGTKERRPSAMQMQAAMRRSGSIDALNRQSAEDARATSPTPTLLAQQPITPLDRNRQYGSVRSILREANTPGSGQNVRFFSRDAYKVISPETSLSAQESSAEHLPEDAASYAQRMQEAAMEYGVMTPGSNPDETRYHSANPSPHVSSSPPNAEDAQYQSASASPHVYSSPDAGDLTGFHSANAYTPSNGHLTHYDSAHASLNGFSGATTFQTPGTVFSEGIPEAQSTPYLTPHETQAQSLGLPTPPPQLSGIFEPPRSHEHNRHSGSSNEFDRAVRGPPGVRPKIDTQTTGNRVSSHSTASSMSLETPHSLFNGSDKSIRRFSDQTQFHSMGDEVHEKSLPERTASSLGFNKVFKRESASAVEGRTDFPAGGTGSINSNRMRALSDRVFSRPSANDSKSKLANSNANSPNDTPFSDSPNSVGEPDPFRADASNYYNSAAGFPNTPPRIGHVHVRADSGVSGVTSAPSMRSFSGTSSIHSAGGRSQTSRTGSMASTSTSQTRHTLQDDNTDTLVALRTQLAFHQELATQYERDLKFRDAHAQLMNQKLAAYEGEAEKRSKAMRAMRKRVAELERAARMLEEAAERSTQESFERSLLDGASGEAVRTLHQQILDLEKAQNEMVAREREQKRENERLGEELRTRDDELERMRKQIEELEKSDRDVDARVREAKERFERQEVDASVVIEQHREIEVAWAEEQARMLREAEDLTKQLATKDSELGLLKQELEAQWGNTEKMNTQVEEARKRMEEGEKERQACARDLEALEKRVGQMEVEWAESENQRTVVEQELEKERRAKVDAERECDEASIFLRQELDRLSSQTANLSPSSISDAELENLRQEHQSALDDAEALQQLLLQRETVNVESSRKLSVKDAEIAKLREELTSLRRDHSRTLAEQARAVSDADAKAENTKDQLGESTRKELASMNECRALREQAKSLGEECEKLRRSVQVLKQESADQDVKIAQMEKQHERELEDKMGLNIALDSKQQELELLKRSIGVKGTAGATPAAPIRSGSSTRRDSVASISSFKTPLPSRPASSMSDAKRPPSRLSDMEKSGKSSAASTGGKVALGKSTRVNLVSSPPPVASTAGVKKVSPRSSVSSVTSPPVRARSTPTATKTAMTTKRISSPPMTLAARRQSMATGLLASSASGNSSTSESSMSDKENETPRARPLASGPMRRMSMQPLAVPA